MITPPSIGDEYTVPIVGHPQWEKQFKQELQKNNIVLIFDIIHGYIDPFHVLSLVLILRIRVTGQRFELEFCSSCAVVPSCGINTGCNSLLLGWNFCIPELSGIKTKIYSQSFLATVCGQRNSFPRQCGYQWSGKNVGLPFSSKESTQPVVWKQCLAEPSKETTIFAPVIEKQWVGKSVQGVLRCMLKLFGRWMFLLKNPERAC